MGTQAVRRLINTNSPQAVIPVTELATLDVAYRYLPFNVTVASIGTVATLWAPAAGRRFRIKGLAMSTSAAGFGILRQAGVASTAFQFNTPATAANTPVSIPNISLVGATVGIALVIDASAVPLTFSGTVWGSEEE